jgi:hypothetical protein
MYLRYVEMWYLPFIKYGELWVVASRIYIILFTPHDKPGIHFSTNIKNPPPSGGGNFKTTPNLKVTSA